MKHSDPPPPLPVPRIPRTALRWSAPAIGERVRAPRFPGAPSGTVIAVRRTMADVDPDGAIYGHSPHPGPDGVRRPRILVERWWFLPAEGIRS